ncbi:uncharacterized protein SPPG_06505 [Spizellomyces punctatus DAOM BR117]|uniref:Uncharacterized protein n=1 Tax=Spizellomyces punctatus (strain DAOM BR117) TaxID=645134 RepID=A0A0L0H996_SPIPD|nr:uncharacterized protein SPPG_06505 [Spizellomyces punctatus DAOM BR117]KNC98095.1 hypothetical protein SPPG_06505 [Spizellomyces punctatus DAOM BR117]|eukprot:XP_016606135.1 hypothetical protein SPPG_06505 [Spizellomyces punctatus DAOM BR117]
MAENLAPDAYRKLSDLKAEASLHSQEVGHQKGHIDPHDEGANACAAFGKYASAMATELELPGDKSLDIQKAALPSKKGSYSPADLARRLRKEAEERIKSEQEEIGYVRPKSAAAKTLSAALKYEETLAEHMERGDVV